MRPRNDYRQYDDLAAEWWRTDGEFAALHWLADARARLVPEPDPGAVAVDVACGGGLMAPHLRGYRHVGVDLSHMSLQLARDHGVEVVRGDVTALPLADECADLVVAGEIFEHVEDLEATVAEVARVLRPGGTLVCDTINSTWWARFSLVTVGERIPGGPPPQCHDARLFVDPRRLVALCGDHGIELKVRGLRFSVPQYAAFLMSRARPVRMVPTRSLAAVYQGTGTKRARVDD
ncbi:MAG: methyltransferase domain-containing protein [Nitriliruptorales bacterium]|nr:methyltransferase domain-containing protein [Nitriliruptorales bacterium]